MHIRTILAGLLLGALAALAALAPVPARARDDGGQVSCGSENGRLARCPVGGWRDARLLRQDSDTRCVRGRNWGFERGAIWVDKGCRGRFAAAGGDRRGDGHRETRIQCGSVDNHYRLCRVRIERGASVRLLDNESDTRCRQGVNWGVSGGGIWVDKGCRGRFVVIRR